ncbi:unnamed protein product [Cladocopium goreaui]|uniref:Uncharacterized protein n=1 Tax=Cladocopium goreaui TaxID=2562237 RepID=A0A9P1G8Z2_9DINO|nr:unnamed protein product [Cladocopium goreaui]
MTELSDLEDDGPSPQVADATPKAKSASRSSDDKCADAKAKAKSKDKAKGSGTKSTKKSRDMKSTKPKKKPSGGGSAPGPVPCADESASDPATEPESEEVSKKPAMKAKAKSNKVVQKRSVPAGTSAHAESGSSEDKPLLKRPAAAPKTVAKAKAKKTQARKYWYYADKKIGIKYDGHERMTVKSRKGVSEEKQEEIAELCRLEFEKGAATDYIKQMAELMEAAARASLASAEASAVVPEAEVKDVKDDGEMKDADSADAAAGLELGFEEGEEQGEEEDAEDDGPVPADVD